MLITFVRIPDGYAIHLSHGQKGQRYYPISEVEGKRIFLNTSTPVSDYLTDVLYYEVFSHMNPYTWARENEEVLESFYREKMNKKEPEKSVIMDDKECDPVNHPSHYTSHPSGVECIDIIQHMTCCAGNAVKYLWRAGLKQDIGRSSREKKLEDLKKARWYVDKEIERVERYEKE